MTRLPSAQRISWNYVAWQRLIHSLNEMHADGHQSKSFQRRTGYFSMNLTLRFFQKCTLKLLDLCHCSVLSSHILISSIVVSNEIQYISGLYLFDQNFACFVSQTEHECFERRVRWNAIWSALEIFRVSRSLRFKVKSKKTNDSVIRGHWEAEEANWLLNRNLRARLG